MSELTIAAHCGDILGECPVWCQRTSRLWWIDVIGALVHNLNPITGDVETWPLTGGHLGSIALREHGGLLVASAAGLDIFDPITSTQTPFKNGVHLPNGHRFNDGRCDRQGRFWVGTMQADLKPEGSLYRIDPDGTATAFFDGIIVPNGVAFSPDGGVFYFADTRRFTIWSFDLAIETGNISERTVFAETTGRPGRPDGSSVDSEGYLWNAEYAGHQVTRYAPDGSVDRVIPLPVKFPTSVCFGGPDLDTLYITSGRHAHTPEEAAQAPDAGALFALKPGVKGLPEPYFRG